MFREDRMVCHHEFGYRWGKTLYQLGSQLWRSISCWAHKILQVSLDPWTLCLAALRRKRASTRLILRAHCLACGINGLITPKSKTRGPPQVRHAVKTRI